MDRNPNEVIFTNLATRVRDNKLLLSLSKEIKSKHDVKGTKDFNFINAMISLV